MENEIGRIWFNFLWRMNDHFESHTCQPDDFQSHPWYARAWFFWCCRNLRIICSWTECNWKSFLSTIPHYKLHCPNVWIKWKDFFVHIFLSKLMLMNNVFLGIKCKFLLAIFSLVFITRCPFTALLSLHLPKCHKIGGSCVKFLRSKSMKERQTEREVVRNNL